MKFTFAFCIFIFAGYFCFAGNRGIYFVQNQGQWNASSRFRVQMNDGFITFNNGSILYQNVSSEHGHEHPESNHPLDTLGSHGHTLLFEFVNAEEVNPIGKEAIATKTHFFQQKNKTFHALNYKRITYEGLWKGINVNFYEENNSLKYEYIVDRRADVSKIKFRYTGANKLQIENGQLIITTSIGELREKKPYAYQDIEGQRIEIPCFFNLRGNEVSFQFPKGYNKNYPLVIDPELIYSTYSGSFADNWGNTATNDEAGNLYAGGVVFGYASLPETPGAFQTYRGGGTDVYILKFDPTGSNLLFAAYLGGTGNEYPRSLIVNKKNELLILGTTDSPDFPTTPGVLDSTYGGGPGFLVFYDYSQSIYAGLPASTFGRNYNLLGTDIFISKINANGDSLLASTYIGGSETDGFLPTRSPLTRNYGDQLRGEILIDKDDNVYFTSNSFSNDIPYINGFQNSHGGNSDGLVGKLSPDLKTAIWMSYLGNTGFESLMGIRVDLNGNTFVVGGTNDAQCLPSANGILPSFQGEVDGILAKINPNGQTLLASTYLGTTGYDQGYFLDFDENQNVYVLGQTNGNYPMDTSVYHVPNGGQFLHCLSPNLDSTIFSTVFGSGSGSPDISLTAFLVNSCAKIYISGWGGSTNGTFQNNVFSFGDTYVTGYVGGNTSSLPISSDAYQSSTDGSDFYFLVLNKGAKSLEYATYFGGPSPEHVDGGTSRFDKKGFIYQGICAGCGGNSGFPSSPGAWSRTNNSFNCNNAALKFDLSTLRAKFETFKTAWTDTGFNSGCADLKVLFKNESSGGAFYKWIWGDGTDTSIVQKDSISHIFRQNRRFKVSLVAFDNTTCAETDTATKFIFAGNIARINNDTTICFGRSFRAPLQINGDTSVRWYPKEYVSDTTARNPILSPPRNITYRVTVKDSLGCTTVDTIKVRVRGFVKAGFQSFRPDTSDPGFNKGCAPLQVLLADSSVMGNRYAWDLGNGTVLRQKTVNTLGLYTLPGLYQVQMVVKDTFCLNADTSTSTIKVGAVVVASSDTTICYNSGFQARIVTYGDTLVRWKPSLFVSDSTIRNPILSPKTNTIYVVSVKDSLGCASSDTLKVNVKGFVKAGFQSFRSDTSDPGFNKGCAPLQVLLADSSVMGNRYAWDLGNGTVLRQKTVNTLGLYTLPGLYQVQMVVKDTFCLNADTSTSTIKVGAVVVASSDTTICYNSGFQARIVTYGDTLVRWKPSLFVSDSTIRNPILSPKTNTTYVVSVKDSLGCASSDTLNVDVTGFVKAGFQSFRSDTSDPGFNKGCAPLQVLLADSSVLGNRYAWDLGNGTVLRQKTVNTLGLYTLPGVYQVQMVVQDTFCLNADTSTSTIKVGAVVVASSDTTICYNSGFQARIVTYGDTLVRWKPSLFVSDSTIRNPILSPKTNTTYVVSVKDSLGCASSDTLNVDVTGFVKAGFQSFRPDTSDPGFNKGCAPLQILLADSSVMGNRYAWDLGNGTVLRQKTANMLGLYTLPGVYQVQMVVQDTFCLNADTSTSTIKVGAVVVASSDTTICYNSGFQARIVTYGDTLVRWKPSLSVSDSTIRNPILSPNTNTTYVVSVKDSLGCASSDTLKVNVTGFVKAGFQSFRPDTSDPGFNKGCAPLQILLADSSVMGNRYAWDLGNGTVLRQKTANTLGLYTLPGVYQVQMVVQDTLCLNADTAIAQLKVSSPSATFPTDFTLCALDSITLRVTAMDTVTQTVQWIPSTGLQNPNAFSTRFFSKSDQTFVISVTDTTLCTISDTLKIKAKNQIPVATFDTYKPDTTQKGYNIGCVPLQILIKNNSSFSDANQWTLNKGISFISNENYQTALFTQRGINTIELIAINTVCGLSDTLTKNIIAQQPTAVFPPPRINCSLDSIVLNVTSSPTNTISWSPATNLNKTTGNAVKYLGFSTITYQITVTDPNGCTLTGNTQITARNQIPVPQFDLYTWPDSLPVTQPLCAPQQIFGLNRSTQADQYQWQVLGLVTTSGQQFPKTTFSNGGSTTTVQLVAINSYCNIRRSTQKSVELIQARVIFPVDTLFCYGTEHELKVSSQTTQQITWSPNTNISQTNILNPKIKALTPITYFVSFIDTNTCIAEDTIALGIHPIQSPQLRPIVPFCEKATQTYTLDAGNYKKYTWLPGGFNERYLTQKDTGQYRVLLEDFNGCTYEDTTKVIALCAPSVFVPSAFSPNQDGVNDYFEVFGSFVTKFQIDIFNRWGEHIYHSDDFDFKWDGKYRGLPSPIGAYPYVIHYEGTTTEGVGVKEMLKGDITLVR